MAVEFSEEGRECIPQPELQRAGSGDGTRIGCRVETLDQVQIGFDVPHYFAQTDFGGVECQHDSAGAAGRHFHVAPVAQRLDDAHKVVARNSVGGADGFGGDFLARVRAQVDQDAEGVIGV